MGAEEKHGKLGEPGATVPLTQVCMLQGPHGRLQETDPQSECETFWNLPNANAWSSTTPANPHHTHGLPDGGWHTRSNMIEPAQVAWLQQQQVLQHARQGCRQQGTGFPTGRDGPQAAGAAAQTPTPQGTSLCYSTQQS